MNDVASPRIDDESIEQYIQRKGKTAPRITPADIEAAIVGTQFDVFPNSQLTICVLTLRNGFTVTGESSCASPENFDVGIGQRIAREDAKRKVWALEGYLLKQRLHDSLPPML